MDVTLIGQEPGGWNTGKKHIGISLIWRNVIVLIGALVVSLQIIILS